MPARRLTKVAYVRMAPADHERVATFAAERNITASAAVRAILRERLDTPLLRPGVSPHKRA